MMRRNDVLVIRYKVKLAFSKDYDEERPRWALCRFDIMHMEVVYTPCTRAVAAETIEKHRMVPVMSNRDGVVYDTADMKLYRSLEGLPYTVREKMR